MARRLVSIALLGVAGFALAAPLAPPDGSIVPTRPRTAPGPVSASGRYVAASAAHATTGPTLPIGKCVNYAGQLDLRRVPPGTRGIDLGDFKVMADAGFATVRIPVYWPGHAGSAPDFTIDPGFMAQVEGVVAAATAAGLNVILDSHYDQALMNDPARETPRFVAYWRQIATRFRTAPASVWFELQNEPRPPLTAAQLPGIIAPALAAVRRTNPTRPVIIGATEWSSIDALATLELPDDRYVVPTFHYYAPMRFTHQGAFFLNPVPPTGVNWGTAADYAALDADVAKVRRYMARTGRVPFIGEYGVFPNVPLEQRVRWYDEVTHAFAAAGVASCVWGWRNDFPIRDARGWIRPLLDAIGTPRTASRK